MKRRKKIFKLIILTIVFAIIVLLLVNKTTIKIYHRCVEYHDLKTNLEILKAEQINYNETLYQIKNNPEYIKKITKAELEFIEDGEVLYVFNEKKKGE